MLRHFSLTRYTDEFKQLGVSELVMGDTHICDASCGYAHVDDDTWVNNQVRAEEYVNDLLAGNKKETIKARIILQCSHREQNAAHISGQNRGIFSGKRIDLKPSLKIIKQDQNNPNKLLKGAKYAIYKVNPNGERAAEPVATGLKTNKKGEHNYNGKLEIGTTYEIVETKAPAGYVKNEDTKRVTIKQGENIVVFKNTKGDACELTLVKVDLNTGETLSGATFGIFRYGEEKNGGYIKEANDEYVFSGTPNSTAAVPDDTLVPKTRSKKTQLYVKQANESTYWYSSNYYTLASNRSQWYMQTQTGDYIEYNFSDTDYNLNTAPDPYVLATIDLYTRSVDDDGNWILNKKGNAYKLTYTESVTKYVKVKKANRGNNYWRVHYRPNFYNKKTNKFESKSIDNMRANSDYHLITDETGEITITGEYLEKGKRYYGIEIAAPAGYKTLYNNGNIFPIGTLTDDQKRFEIEVPNEKPKGDLLLRKVNSDHEEIVLNGVQFRFYNKECGWVVMTAEGLRFSDKKNDATVFTTGVDGMSPGDGCILVRGLRIGEYEYYEDANSLQNSNPNYGMIDTGSGDVTINENTRSVVVVKNTPLYVSLSGNVWLDGRTFKNGDNDNLYDPLEKMKNGLNCEDTILSKEEAEKIKVEFVVINPYTNEQDHERSVFAGVDQNGHWKMDKIEIGLINGEDCSNIAEYGNTDFRRWKRYIRFTYDGLTYDAVIPYNELSPDIISEISKPDYLGSGYKNVLESKGSKAKEVEEERNALNAKFATVEGVAGVNNQVQAKNVNGEQTSVVTYRLDHSDSSSTASVIDATNVEVGAEFAKNDNNKPNNAKDLYYNRGDTSYEIKNINLGLKKKAQIDLALIQDVQEVDVGIKGEHHIYEYNSVGTELKNQTDVVNANNVGKQEWERQEPAIWDNVGVAFGTNLGTYKQPVYRADFVYYNNKDTNNNLEMVLTYKITLRNQTAFSSQVHSITEYFDAKYNLYQIGTGLADNHKIQGALTLLPQPDTIGEYKKINIDLSKLMPNNGNIIGPYENKEIYIQFKLDQDNVLGAMRNPGEIDGYSDLKSVAEITSYTTYKDGNYYATVDKDSVIDNAAVGDMKTYEDDTRKAPGLCLVLKDPRQITGYVFEDLPEEEKLNSNLREGDGIKSENEKNISGVQVEFLEKTSDGYTNVFDIEDRVDESVTMDDSNGQYTISGFTPGTYKVRFIWGKGETTKTIDIDTNKKIINATDFKSTIFNKDIYSYASTNTDWYRNKLSNDNLSCAFDDWTTRQNIDDRLNVNGNDYNFNSKKDDELDNIKNSTEMQSYTPDMKFKIEYDDVDLNNLNVVPNADGTTTKVVFATKGINLGIIERPRQDISIEKRIKNIKLKYSSGETVVDADVDMNGNLTGQSEYTSYIGDSRNRRNSLIRIEADTEILQNSSMEAIYEFTIKNEGEIEYSNQDFYNLGSQTNNNPESAEYLVKIKPSKIMDYLNNNCIAKVNSASTINDTYKWDLKSIEDVNSSELVDTTSDFKSAVKDELMYLTEKAADVAPAQNWHSLPSTATVELEIEKRLSSNYDDKTDISNQVEIIAIKKDFGRRIINSIPGNFVPNKAVQEIDDAMSENITIISSTGANRNYAIYITISIIILTAIAGGIYYIKRKNRK